MINYFGQFCAEASILLLMFGLTLINSNFVICIKIKIKKQAEQISRTETELHIWRSFGGLSVGRQKGVIGGKGARIKKYKLDRYRIDRGMLRTV